MRAVAAVPLVRGRGTLPSFLPLLVCIPLFDAWFIVLSLLYDTIYISLERPILHYIAIY